MSDLPVECGNCGAHFQLDPAGNVADAACSECGGTRFFRNQPSPTQSEGTLRNMVDSTSQKDQGGNPLGEGTIVGDDGEKPAWKRDNFMHGKVADHSIMYEQSTIPEGMSLRDHRQTPHQDICPMCGEYITEPLGFNLHLQQKHPEQWGSDALLPLNRGASVTETIDMDSRSLNMEPYAPLWDESYLPSKTAGPLAELAAPLAEAVGGGAESGLLGKIAPTLMKGALLGTGSQMVHGLLGGGDNQQGGQQAGGMAPDQPDPAPSLQQLGNVDIPFLLTSDLETPHSYKSVDEQHDDPEQQDQKEFNDGDQSPSNLRNPELDDSGAMGEDAVRDHAGFGADSPAIERMMMVMPLLMHYFNSEESGQNDPIVRGLHDALDQESPGYLEREHPDGHNLVQLVVQQQKQPHGVHAGVNAMPGGLPAVPSPGGAMPAPGGVNPGGGSCPNCGGVLAGDGSCPQCGASSHPQGGAQLPAGGSRPSGTSLPPNMANHQGPSTPEQIAAVQQYLMSQGKDDLVPDVPLHPENYAHIMAEIQGNPNVAPLVDPSEMTPPPGMMNPQGGMPVMDPTQMGGGGGMPMQPMAARYPDHLDRDPTYDEWGNYTGDRPRGPKRFPWEEHRPGPGEDIAYQDPMYDPGDQTQYIHPTREFPPGPNTNPRGFGQIDEEDYPPNRKEDYLNYIMQEPGRIGTTKTGDANNVIPRCPKCQSATTTYMDGTDGESQQKARCHACDNIFSLSDKQSSVILAEIANPVLQNAAEQHEQRSEGGHDPSMTWVDDQGQPLTEGQTYELHSPGYAIPDEVQVVYKKPDELGLKLVGEISNIHSDDGAPDFKVTPQQMMLERYTFTPSNVGEDTPEQPLGGMPGLEQIPQSGQTTDEASNSYPNQGTVSRLLTATEEDEVEQDDDLCHRCGGTWVEHTASSPSRTMHECARCGSVWETVDEWSGHQSNNDLGWLYEGSQDADFSAKMERARAMSGGSGNSRSIAAAVAKDERYQAIQERLNQNGDERQRLAGRHFTPAEQRELINERGSARNQDLLDLAGTHYELRDDPTGKANGANVPDEHILMGL